MRNHFYQRKDGEGKNDPILSLEFHSSGVLVTAGHDAIIRFWKLALPIAPTKTTSNNSTKASSSNADGTAETKASEGPCISCVVELTGHINAVNVVRFSPNYECLASAGDDGKAIIWYPNRDLTSPDWSWGDITSHKELSSTALSGHGGDITDVAWSPDGTRIVTASIDNSAIIWNVRTGKSVQILRDHNHYVQGVAWDVYDQFIASQSCDRTCRLYGHQKNKPICADNVKKSRCVQRAVLRHRKFEDTTTAAKDPTPAELQKAGARTAHKKHLMFLDDTVPTFFRRPCFSPCGSMLFSPAGQFIPKSSDRKAVKTTFMHVRNQWDRPAFHYPGYAEASVVVKCCPVLFKRAKRDGIENVPGVNYRIVFAIATIDEILVYDTQCYYPIIVVKNTHYAAITDLAWSCDGTMLAVSSQDGYCTFISLVAGELGEPLPQEEVPEIMKRKIPRVFAAKVAAETKTSSPRKDCPEIVTATAVAAEAALPVATLEPALDSSVATVEASLVASTDVTETTTPVKQNTQPRQPKRITPTLVGGISSLAKRKSPDYAFGSRPKRRCSEVPVDNQDDEDSDSDFAVEAMDEVIEEESAEEGSDSDAGEAMAAPAESKPDVSEVRKPKRITPILVGEISLKSTPMTSTVPDESSVQETKVSSPLSGSADAPAE